MSDESEIKVLLVDDHAVVREGLRTYLDLEDRLAIVGEAANGREAVDKVRVLRPDVVLMDLLMPEMDGITATKAIKEVAPEVKIIVLTSFQDDEHIMPAIEAGATGYLLKDAPRDDVFRAIRAAARGEAVLAPAVATRLMGRMRAPADDALSAREVEVLLLVARGASNKMAASSLHISEATVKTHLIHIFGKLGVADRTAAVTVAMERGILRLEP